MPKLLIVESPKKARTIQKFIGKDWIVKASFGHIRQLAKDGDRQMGFDIVGDHGSGSFADRVECRYAINDSRTRANLKQLKQLVKTASLVVIATDPDREGEAIAFHLVEELKPRNYQRVTYGEVTEKAVRYAITQWQVRCDR